MRPSSLSIRNGLLIDPAEKLEGKYDLLLKDGRVTEFAPPASCAARPTKLQRSRTHRRTRLHRYSRSPARAGTVAQRDHRQRHHGSRGRRLYLRLLHAQHQPGKRFCRHHALDARPCPWRPRQCLSRRRGHSRQPGRAAHRLCRAQRAGAVALSDDGKPILEDKIMRQTLAAAAA